MTVSQVGDELETMNYELEPRITLALVMSHPNSSILEFCLVSL